uniref:RING-type domain-containing protein n=1 Tax=Rhabditophanes sp. KR3021 TaxID=114890 RepID=A0AC35U345_9BILA
MDAKENKRPYTPENPSFENPCNGTKKPKKAHHIVEYECIICTKTLKHPGEPHGICIVSRCGHVFGRSCLLKWFSTGRKYCPTCQIKIKDTKEVINIYGLTQKSDITDVENNSVNYEKLYLEALKDIEILKKEQDKLKREIEHTRNNNRYLSNLSQTITTRIVFSSYLNDSEDDVQIID